MNRPPAKLQGSVLPSKWSANCVGVSNDNNNIYNNNNNINNNNNSNNNNKKKKNNNNNNNNNKISTETGNGFSCHLGQNNQGTRHVTYLYIRHLMSLISYEKVKNEGLN